ncbi:PRKG2 [Symbiodinium necroappetens]|uniref:PRKG2 protein n=1 Tax=Symbiodinium necroappetens TaxID=1628268 RepID=A0A812SVU4_9DINO|nr:PRKG2 [Symbiodinium necroappetens]
MPQLPSQNARSSPTDSWNGAGGGSESADLSPRSWPRSEPDSPGPEKPGRAGLKSVSTAARAAVRFRHLATSAKTNEASESSSGREARLIRRHPFFADTSKDFREEVVQAVRPYNVDAIEPGISRKADSLSDALFDPLPAIVTNQVIMQPGCRVPDERKGIVLAIGDPQDLQVLYNQTTLSSDLHDSFIPGVAGQDVAFQLVEQSLFRVQKRPSADLCLLRADDLERLSQRYGEDYQKLQQRARKMTCSLIRAWARKFHMRCYPKLFCNVSQEFMSTFADLMQVRVHAAGQTICAEGDPGNFGFYLHSGRALVCRGSTSIIRLSREQDGAWKSWWGMLEVGATCVEQTCTVVAESDCVAWVLQIKDSEELRVKFPRESGLFDRISIRHLQLLSPHMDGMQLSSIRHHSAFIDAEMLSSSPADALPRENMWCEGAGRAEVAATGLLVGFCLAALGISKTRKETVMADTVCDIRALSRKALLAVLDKFPEEEERMMAIVEAHSQSRKAASLALEQASAGEGGFSQDFIRMLVDNMYEQPYMVNQVILQQGMLGTHFVVLVHGIVEIEANGMVVATVSAPGIFGERGFLVSGSRSGATVRCTTVAECMMLPVDGPSTPVIRQLYQADIQKLERMLQKKMQSTVQTLSQKGSNLPQAQQNTSFLKNCDPSFLTRMAQHLEKQVFMAGQPLLEEDVDAGFCLLIQQGVACVEKAGKVVAKIGAGEFIGELVALGFATAASQTIRAEERVLAFAINNDAFRELVDEFPEEKQKLLELARQRIQANAGRRRSSRGLFGRPDLLKAVSVVAAFQKNEERRSSRSLTGEGALLQPEDTQQVRRLPGYRSGVKWVKQRRAALEEATYVKLKRTTLRNQQAPGDEFEPLMPLPPLQGYRPPEKGPGTPWSAQSQRQAMPASVMRLRKFKKLYGRNVWLETCTPWSRPSIPPASGSATPIAGLATEDTGSSTAARPRPLELNDDGKDEAAVTMEPAAPTSPEAAQALRHKLAGTLAPSMFEQMHKWFSAVQGDEEGDLTGVPRGVPKNYLVLLTKESRVATRYGSVNSYQGAIDKTACEERSPIEKLSLFLQQAGTGGVGIHCKGCLSSLAVEEEEAEESYRRERRHSHLCKGFHAWKVFCFGRGTASKSAAAADEPNIVDLDYSSREGGEGWLALDIADREGLNLTS